MGAPLGNKNNVKNKIWTLAINKALANRSQVDKMEELEKLANALIDKCYEGDMVALKELGDRLEGKPAQSVTVSGDDDNPLVTRIERIIVNATDKDGKGI